MGSAMILEIIRLEENFEFGTFGVLKINKELFCFTLEPRDEENASRISSIPAQQYECRRYSSRKFPDTWQIMNVPGRDNVLFHSGNVASQTQGCILLAQHIGKLQDNRAVLNSGATFQSFMNTTAGLVQLHLTITENY